ncbi:MAG: low molecular weight protein-tyrosine-phosphatase [Shimia sp.]
MQRILVVCVGNICRSPLGERILRDALPDRFTVTSAGIGALEGHAADAVASEVAAERGVSLDGHVARQFTKEIGADQDLILVMEPGHKREIARLVPELSGRVMLFDQWTRGTGIADPYRQSRAFHEAVNAEVTEAARAWAGKLAPKG